MVNKYNKQFLKKYFIYAIGNIGTKFIMFLLFPILTFYLKPEELGTFDLYFTIIIILGQITTLNLRDGLFRFMIKSNKEKSYSILQVFIQVFLINAIALSFIAIILYTAKIELAFNPFLLAIFYLSFNFFDIYQYIIRAAGKIQLFVLSNLISAIITTCLTILLLKYTNLKGTSLIISYTIAKIISFLIIEYYYPVIFPAIKYGTTYKRLNKYLIAYSLFLLPANLATSGIDNWGKLYIVHFLGEYSNGIYAIVIKYSSIFYIFISIYHQTWQDTALREYKSCKNRSKYFSGYFNSYLLLLSVTVMGFMLAFYLIFPYITGHEYINSLQYIFLQLIAIFFLALSYFIGVGYECSYQVKRAIYSSICATIISLILNFIFIPYIGLLGCFCSNIISYAAMFLYRLIDIRSILKITLNIKGFIGIIILISTFIIWIFLFL